MLASPTPSPSRGQICSHFSREVNPAPLRKLALVVEPRPQTRRRSQPKSPPLWFFPVGVEVCWKSYRNPVPIVAGAIRFGQNPWEQKLGLMSRKRGGEEENSIIQRCTKHKIGYEIFQSKIHNLIQSDLPKETFRVSLEKARGFFLESL